MKKKLHEDPQQDKIDEMMQFFIICFFYTKQVKNAYRMLLR